MKKMNFLKIACAAALSAACCFAAVGCSQTKSDSGDVSVSDTSEGVAATVNGTEIGEKAVTSYIANFRSMSNLESDADWAQWLVDNNYTAADIREEVINYYASQELIRQAAEENDIKVESSEIDSQVQQMRSYYDSDEDWENALKQIGTTESQYRSLLEISMLQQALQE
ncbi:SurA N-terminal domain-containing protein, partial [Slackia isoflavoniconvertens]